MYWFLTRVSPYRRQGFPRPRQTHWFRLLLQWPEMSNRRCLPRALYRATMRLLDNLRDRQSAFFTSTNTVVPPDVVRNL